MKLCRSAGVAEVGGAKMAKKVRRLLVREARNKARASGSVLTGVDGLTTRVSTKLGEMGGEEWSGSERICDCIIEK